MSYYNQKLTFVLALVCALFLTTGASAQELTSNGGFETGDTSDWEDLTTPPQTFSITSDANSGSWAAEIFNNVDSGAAAVVKQANIGVGTVSPGDLIEISFAAKGSFAQGGVAFAEFFSELDGGGTSSSEILSGGPLALTDQYQDFSFTTTAGPDVSGGVTLQFNAATGAVPGSTSVLFIDDASVRIVPEPTSIALFGLGCLGALVRRRR
ncbi:MAG: PEP-CTERM sorting domain-containing protein [Planctomycetota bacterium]